MQDFLDVIAIVSQPKLPRRQHIKHFAGELRDKFKEKKLLGLAEIVRDTHTLGEWSAHQLTFYQNAFSHICLEISLITSRPVAEITQEIKALLIKAAIVPERGLKLV